MDGAVSAFLATLIGLVGGALGWLAKWWFEQRSARRAAEREFAGGATKQVVELAGTYYWSLANHAESLAGALVSHLQTRAAHLMIGWSDDAELQGRLDELTREVADDSFPTFCRLVSRFDEFQFRGSNTYLLQSHRAGEVCKQLYIAFADALALDEEGCDLRTGKIISVMQGKPPGGLSAAHPDCSRVFDLPDQVLVDTVVPWRLEDERAAWERWLGSRIPDVSLAADALRTYGQLLSHELALLYRAFYRDRSGLRSRLRRWFSPQGADDRESLRQAADRHRWLRVLDRRSLATIEVLGLRPRLLRAMGRGFSAAPSRETPRPGEEAPTADRRRERPRGASPGPGAAGFWQDPTRDAVMEGARRAGGGGRIR